MEAVLNSVILILFNLFCRIVQKTIVHTANKWGVF